MGEKVWNDKKRFLGMPITFTNYSLSDDRLFVETGVFTRQEDQILLYRIRDLSTSITLFQRMLGVGTITVMSSDKSNPVLKLTNIKNPKKTAQLIHESVEKMKMERGMRIGEVLESSALEDSFDIAETE